MCREDIEKIMEYQNRGIQMINDLFADLREEIRMADYEDKRDEMIENEVNDILYEKQADLEDLAKDNFLDK